MWFLFYKITLVSTWRIDCGEAGAKAGRLVGWLLWW